MLADFLGLSPAALFGLFSAVLSTFAYLPYMRDTILRRTQPQRASWLIWSILGSIAFMSQLHEGATHSLMFAGAQVSGTIIVFVLSIRLGVGGFLSRQDGLVLALAGAGIAAWSVTDTPAYALAITISVSLVGGAATARKAYLRPGSETEATWWMSFAGAACAIVAVGRMDWIILAYPLYLLGLSAAILGAVRLGRARYPFRSRRVLVLRPQDRVRARAPQQAINWTAVALKHRVSAPQTS